MSAPGSVPRLWPGSTIICIAPGPSLTPDDVEACRGYPVVALNDAYQMAPWADVLYGADVAWWQRKPSAWALPGLKFAMPPQPPADKDVPDLTILGYAGKDGLSDDPRMLCSGGHTGYSGINLATHAVGPGGTIVLLGYDMQPGPHGENHFFGEHPDGSHPRYAHWLKRYQPLPALLAAKGIALINATRETAISWIPRMDIRSALTAQETLCARHRQ